MEEEEDDLQPFVRVGDILRPSKMFLAPFNTGDVQWFWNKWGFYFVAIFFTVFAENIRNFLLDSRYCINLTKRTVIDWSMIKPKVKETDDFHKKWFPLKFKLRHYFLKINNTVETRMVGSELNIFSNHLWRIYQYQLADYCTHTGIY